MSFSSCMKEMKERDFKMQSQSKRICLVAWHFGSDRTNGGKVFIISKTQNTVQRTTAAHFCPGLPMANGGNGFVWLVKEKLLNHRLFKRYEEVAEFKNTWTEVSIRAFKEAFTRQGTAEFVVPDNKPQFLSDLFREENPLGPRSLRVLKTNKRILKSTLKQTESHCRDFKIGVMCALF